MKYYHYRSNKVSSMLHLVFECVPSLTIEPKARSSARVNLKSIMGSSSPEKTTSSVLFIIPVIVEIAGHRFEIYILVSEIHDNVDLVLGIKNVFKLEGVFNL